MSRRLKFFEDDDVEVESTSSRPQESPIKEEIIQQPSSKSYRYRVEQTLIMKINGIISSHGVTKQEYLLQKNFNGNNLHSIGFQLLENVVQFNPKQLETAIELICEIDKIKSLVDIEPSKSSGKMIAIVKKENAIAAWEDYKKLLDDKFDFLKTVREKESITAFIELMDNQFNDNQLLLSDFESRIFYDVIFDKYLIGKENFEPFTKDYLSNIFPHNLIQLNVVPLVTQQSKTEVTAKQVGVLNKKEIDLDGFKRIYDEKYKPQVGFGFSEYNYSLVSNFQYDVIDNSITEAHVTINEEVKNNVEIIIDFRLKKVEL